MTKPLEQGSSPERSAPVNMTISGYLTSKAPSAATTENERCMKSSRLQLRGHIAYDIDSAAESKLPTSVLDLSTWDPPNRQSVAVGLQLDIGWDDDVGTDVFSTCFATDEVAYSVEVRNLIRLPYFDWDELQQRLLTILERCERENWKESVRQLREQLDWEFDGMAAYDRWLREPRDWP